jgi:hypothetical protein
MGLSLMNILRLLSNVCIAHRACYWKLFLLHYTQVLCQYRLYKADHAYLTSLFLQWQLSHLNDRKFDNRQVYASYIFYVWHCLVLCYGHVHSYDFVRLLLADCTVLLYNRKYMEVWMLCASLKISNSAENLLYRRWNLKKEVSAANSIWALLI